METHNVCTGKKSAMIEPSGKLLTFWDKHLSMIVPKRKRGYVINNNPFIFMVAVLGLN
jgi:hypothetical protein